jgi:hypothetical protein
MAAEPAVELNDAAAGAPPPEPVAAAGAPNPPAEAVGELEAAAPPAPPAKPPPAKKPAKKDGKKDAKKGAPAVAGDGPSVAAHPRAARGVARAKSWGGLAGFLIGGYLSLPTHTLADAALRALVAGVIAYVAVWAAAVFVWRRLVMLEIRGREQQLLAARLPREAGAVPGGPPAGPAGASPPRGS